MSHRTDLDAELRDLRRRSLTRGCAIASAGSAVAVVLEAGAGGILPVTVVVRVGLAIVLGSFAVLLARGRVDQVRAERGVLLTTATLSVVDTVGRSVELTAATMPAWLLTWVSYVVLLQIAAHVVLTESRLWRSWVPLAVGYGLVVQAGVSSGLWARMDATLVVPLIAGGLLEVLQRTLLTVARHEQTARAAAEEGRHDLLTGLPNRRGLAPALEAVVPGDAVLLLDVDRFKEVNDQHGHDVGDVVLQRVAGLLRSALPHGASVARWGGEEFVVLTHADRDPQRLAERIRRSVAECDERPAVTVSVGAADVRDVGGHQDALRRADACLYAAKSRGRDRVVVDPGSGVIVP